MIGKAVGITGLAGLLVSLGWGAVLGGKHMYYAAKRDEALQDRRIAESRTYEHKISKIYSHDYSKVVALAAVSSAMFLAGSPFTDSCRRRAYA